MSRSRHIVPVELGHSGLGLRIPEFSPHHLEFTVGRRDPGGKEIGCFWGGREGFGKGATCPGGGVSDTRMDCWGLCGEKERDCRGCPNAGEEGSASPGCAHGEFLGAAERTAVAGVFAELAAVAPAPTLEGLPLPLVRALTEASRSRKSRL